MEVWKMTFKSALIWVAKKTLGYYGDELPKGQREIDVDVSDKTAMNVISKLVAAKKVEYDDYMRWDRIDGKLYLVVLEPTDEYWKPTAKIMKQFKIY
jgi:hypothetical protein